MDQGRRIVAAQEPAPRGSGAPASLHAAGGAGSNVFRIDPGRDLVVVGRWIDEPSVDGGWTLAVDRVRERP